MSENTSEVDDSTPPAKAEPDKSESSPSVIATTEKSESYTKPKAEKKKVSIEKPSKHHRRPSKIKEKWGALSPYLDKSELNCALAEPSVVQYEFKSRITASGVVEPHISFKMDNMSPDLLTKQLENWNRKLSASHKMGKFHSDRRVNIPSGAKRTEQRPQKLKKKKHNFDDENKHDYFETRRQFFILHLQDIKSQAPFYQAALESALINYMGMTKGSLTAIKELTRHYCH